jgi:hypothetical protein
VPIFVAKIAEYMKSKSLVNQSYAAACLEKLLIRKSQDGSNRQIFTTETLDNNLVMALLSNLTEALQENKNLYAIRALFRVTQVAGPNIQLFAQ